jgi:hypothetical protein
MRLLALAALVLGALVACNTGSKETAAPEPAPSAPAAPAITLGTPIETSVQKVTLTDVAKNPNAFVGKKFATTGTVTAVCQHMGCWMEIKDESSEAHIKMAGHAFFVPKSASGKKARVLGTLVKSEAAEGACSDEGHDKAAAAGGPKKGCRAEAEAQLGRPLAKLELVADGVELM